MVSSHFCPAQVCPAKFARTKFAQPSLPEIQICPQPNLPQPKFARSHFCPSQICPDPFLPRNEFGYLSFKNCEIKKKIEKCYYLQISLQIYQERNYFLCNLSSSKWIMAFKSLKFQIIIQRNAKKDRYIRAQFQIRLQGQVNPEHRLGQVRLRQVKSVSNQDDFMARLDQVRLRLP